MSHQRTRVLLVNGGLLAAGAAFGGLATAAALAVVVALTEGVRTAFDLRVLALTGAIGALYGGVLFPAAAWLLLRRVPLGTAVLGVTAGTVLGAVLGWTLPSAMSIDTAGTLGGFLGFAAACVLLRRFASRG
jgi:hypothetical protein